MFETSRSILRARKMTHLRLSIGAVVLGLCRMAAAQDLAPRAYIISPIHSNAVVTSYSFYTGNLDFAGGLPITDATATANVGNLSYTHSIERLRADCESYPRVAVRTGEFQWEIARQPNQCLPLGAGRFCLPLFSQSVGRPGDGPEAICEVAAEDAGWGQHSSGGADGPIRFHQADQLWGQPLGIQTGSGVIAPLGTLGPRRLRRDLVLYHQPQVLLSEPVQSRDYRTDPGADWLV